MPDSGSIPYVPEPDDDEREHIHAHDISLLAQLRGAEREFLAGKREHSENVESAVRVFLEYLRGVEFLNIDQPCVTVFGSARFKEDHPYYMMAREVGRALAEQGFAVMTGGGPGIMEAANRGAKEAGGLSIGANIHLPREQKPNDYVDRWIEFDHFFVRKVMMVKFSCAFVVMPGGFGTMDEVFETLTLIQTRKIDYFPVVTMGADLRQSVASPPPTNNRYLFGSPHLRREVFPLAVLDTHCDDVVWAEANVILCREVEDAARTDKFHVLHCITQEGTLLFQREAGRHGLDGV